MENVFNLERMQSSYNNISFYSERRGKQDHAYYTELLENDLEELGDNQGNYKRKFIERVETIISRRFNCASAFICGPANFNNARNLKRWDSMEKAVSDLDHWRKKYFKAVNRVRTLSPEAELDNTIEIIDNLERIKESMKIVNNAFKVSEEIGIDHMTEYFSSMNMTDVVNNKGFKSYQITSLTGRIREAKKKINVMKIRIEAKNNFKDMVFNGGKIYIDNDRVIIEHIEKPSKEIIQKIKSKGFRYSPKFICWVRKHTMRARIDALYLFNNVFNVEVES